MNGTIQKCLKTLEENKINYKSEFKIEECKNILPLPFDIGILNEKEELLGLIEYQGEQHYKPINYWRGKKGLEVIQKRDLIKFNYCKDNNIPLLRIHYQDFLKIDELIINFNNFIKKENKDEN